MVILHIACITDDPFSGVYAVVPQHIREQQRISKVGFVNIKNVKFEGIDNQFDYFEGFNVGALPKPFCDPDIIVFHEAYRVQYLRISADLRSRKIPYVILPHGELSDQAQKKKWIKKKAANLLLFNRFINNSAAVQCLSQREFNSTKFGKRKIIVTNGMHLPSKEKSDFRNEGKKFVYIGRLDPYHKGLDLMIAAIALKAELIRKSGASFFIYGPDAQGYHKQLNRMLEENGVTDIVSVNGAVMGSEKQDILLDSDIFIQTSRFEGMPMGILEALSYGLPCLVTSGTTLAETVSENEAGWSCEVDIQAIANTIEAAVADKNMKAKSVAAVKVIENNFSWEQIAQNTISNYQAFLTNE